MESTVFELFTQNQSTEAKIVVALERIAESFRIALWQESKETALSPIQIQILIFLLFHSAEKRKVSYLAQEFNMTKATISDAVKILAQKGLISKEIEAEDGRSYVIHLTEQGRETAQKTASFANILSKPVADLSQNQKEVLLESLLALIYKLHQANIIQLQRMCFLCRFYAKNEGNHFCNLLQKPLKNTELRVDCDEYEMIR